MLARLALLAGVVTLLALPGTAAAKGPESATVSGPGLDGSTAVPGQGEGGGGTPLGSLVESAGFFPAAFGQSPDPMLDTRPAGDLGPRYTIRYRVPGPNDDLVTVTQDVYPYAKPSPVSFMPAGQSFFDGQRTRGGWYVGGAGIRQALVDVGLPATPPSAGGGSSFLGLEGTERIAAGLALAVVLVLGGGFALAVRRRPRPVSAP